MAKFLRTGWKKYSKLGLRRKKKQVYRKSKGTDSKIRLKMKGHIKNISIGFRGNKKERALIKGLRPILIYNIEDLKKIDKNKIGIIGKIGNRKKIKIASYAKGHNMNLANLNPDKYLQKTEDKIKQRKELRKKRIEKRRNKDKKEKKKTKNIQTQSSEERKVKEATETTESEQTKETKTEQSKENSQINHKTKIKNESKK